MIRLDVRAAALPLTLLFVLAACGGGTATDGAAQGGGESAAAGGEAGGDGAQGDGGGVDLCSVLTAEEVSAELGVEIEDTTPVSSAEVSSCNYNTADGTPVAGNTYTRGTSAFSASQMFDANIEGAEEISGLGDRAIMVGDETFPILMVLKGDGLYQITVSAEDLDAAAKRDAMIELARISMDRLP